MGTTEEKTERNRAESNLRRMKEIERQYRQERRPVEEQTECGGVRIKYVKQDKTTNDDSKLV